MGQKKLVRFAELLHFSNVLQNPEGMPGKWNGYFKNDHPVTLELACGKGEYAVGLAQLYPDRNFIGVDVKGNRLWVGAKKATTLGLDNVAFLRIQIDRIVEFFGREEIAEIWITFPDPQLRISRDKKRLTHPKFLRLYQQILKPGGKINLKTDSPVLYDFTLKVVEMYGCTLHASSSDVYAQAEVAPELQIKTHYESLDIAGSNRVHYVCFSLPQTLPGKELDLQLHELLKLPPVLTEGRDYYLNEQGLMVLTAAYHLQRGYCCGKGCLHCPFEYQAVPEPKRSELLQQKEKR